MTSTILKASVLLRLVLICVLIISMGVAIWLIVLAHKIDSGSQSTGYYVTSMGIFFIVGLVGKRAFDLCSVTLTEEGVAQLSIFSRNRLLLKKELLWSEITNVGAKPGSFLLSGRENSIEVNTSVFSNAAEVIDFVKAKCSK